MSVEFEFSSTGTAHIVTAFDPDAGTVETKCNQTLDSPMGPMEAESTRTWPTFSERCRNCAWDDLLLRGSP